MKKTFTKQFEWVIGMTGSTSCFSPTRRLLLLLCLILVGVGGAKADDVPSSWQDVKFNEDIRYSQWVINSRISDFYGNKTQRGFNTYDESGSKISNSKGTQKFDYVPGLVAKAVLEAYANYNTFDWSKPWFYSVMNYAKDNTYKLIDQGTSPDYTKITLDNMNACKMYFPLMATDVLSDGAKSKGETAIANVLKDMQKYNSMYVIGGSESGVKNSTNDKVKSMFGGWFHKPEYKDQMWCDGLYMGAALLAQIIKYKGNAHNITASSDTNDDWDLIAKQFTISWNQLYDSSKGLLFHAFTANPKDNASTAWSGISNTTGSEVYHSEAFWGRAIGWYFLALVDVLEQMPSNNSNYEPLKGYLDKLAAGLAKYQDETSGCWYQVIDEKDNALTDNYLESSCTSLFAAAYLKACRLNLLTDTKYKTIGENAFKGAVAQFMKCDTYSPASATTVQLVHNCASAGLGGKDNRSGSRDYYINGSDVGQTNNKTEGKVMGAFIMAATEYEKANAKAIRFSYDLAPTYTLSKGQSLKVEALGSGAESATYQWYKKEGTTSTAVNDAKSATFAPATSGSYYCEATTSDKATTIKTSTALVTVNESASNEGSGSGEKVLFSTDFTESAWGGVTTTSTNSTTTATINGTQVTLKGYKNNGFSVSGGVLTFPGNNMSDNGNYYIAIPVTGVNGSITIEFGGTNGYKYYYDICASGVTPSRTETKNVANGTVSVTESYSGSDAVIYIGQRSSDYKTISSIKITTPSSSSSGTPSSDASATFTYNGSALTFTGNTATINLASTQAGSTITVTATPAAGATIATTSSNTSITNNVISITAPAAGSNVNYVYTVKAEDGTTIDYTINVSVAAAPVLYTVTFNAGTNGTCSTTSLTQESQGASITLPSVTPKTGYKFDGWYNAETGGTKVGGAGDSYTPSADITLYAQYKSTSSSAVVATFENAKKSPWNDTENKGFVISGVSNIKDGGAKLSSGGEFTIKIPEGFTVTGFDFSVKCSNTSEGSTLSVGDDKISVHDGTHTLHHMNLSSSVTGPTTLTITNSGAKELNIASIKVYGSNGKSISFTTQPVSATYLKDATSPAALTVEAKVNNVTGTAPTISYQWYSNTTNSTDAGTAIDDQKGTSYTPVVSTAGTKYYYCKATATVDGETLEAYSNIATITVNNPTLTIKTQPVGATYGLNQTGVAALMVEAETNTSETIEYQWYKNSSNSTLEAEAIGEDKATYEPAVSAVGTTYYYCVVKAGKSLTATTNIVAIVVNNEQPIYGYKVSKAGLTAPDINTSKYITTTSDDTGATGEKLVKMTFGGWKWNDGKYKKPDSETEIQDTWRTSETVSGVTVLDGYSYWFSGTQDAKQENKDAETTMYGQIRNGWFVSPTRKDGVTTESHPYTLPVRGSFMTFEPTMNGTLTIYILQNGAWNTFDKATTLDGVSYAKGDIKPGEFRMHAFQVTNQRGLVLEEFAPKYTVTNNQKVDAAYSCSKYADTDEPTTFDKTSKDISQWEEFWALTENERKAVYTNWKNGPGETQTIIKLDNGSFLAIQKAVVKYQFHVTGNETYYFFSNFSKMGFSGATFQPDGESGQPSDATTFSGDNSLSDTKAFPKIDKTADGTIGETGMTNYKYTIDENEVGKVDGVFIPQFKEITLNRTFTANQWTTLTLPFNLTQTEVQEIFGSGTQLIQLKNASVNNGCARLEFVYHEIQNVLPGYPYLIKPTQTLSTFTVNNKCINPMIDQTDIPCGAYTFKGVPGYSTPGSTEISGKEAYSVKFKENDIFVSDGNGQMYVSAGNSYGKGYRAWFKYNDGISTSGKINSISLVIDNPGDDDDNVVTTIDMVDVDPDVFNALGIATGVYNLNGQKVSDDMRSLPKGIYIVNGKKIVRK